MQKAGLAKNGRHYVWMRVEIAADDYQLACFLWDGVTWQEQQDRGTLSAKRVDEAIRDSMKRRGDEFFVEDDDDFEFDADHGGKHDRSGKDWVLEHVRRVYQFPENRSIGEG